MSANAELSYPRWTSLNLVQVIRALVACAFELERKYWAELKASLNTLSVQVFMMHFSELENIPAELGHVASNIRDYSFSEIGSNILPPQKCLLATSLRERLLKFP